MKSVKTEEAVGMVLGHDITEIVPGEFKGVAFKTFTKQLGSW